MTLLLPHGWGSALRPAQRENADADKNWEKLGKVAERGKAAEPTHAERSAAIGKMLMSGELRAGSGGGMLAKFGGTCRGGPVTDAAFAKFWNGERRLTSDKPDQVWLNRQVADYLRHAAGINPVNGRVFGAFGAGPRAIKAAGDANLDSDSVKPLNQDALDGLNQLSGGLRQRIVAALFQSPGADKYRWAQWIRELRDEIDAECKDMGIDAKALIRALNLRSQFFDPMTQNNPFQPPPGSRALAVY